MRDRETIDSELRRIALGRRSIREQGGQPSSPEVDRLLDELLAHSAGVVLPDPVPATEAAVVTAVRTHSPRTVATRRRRKGASLRLGLTAALPLSLIAGVAAVVAMFAIHHQDSAAEATEAPSSAAAPSPNQNPAKAPVARIDMADAALVAALKQQGIPVPSQEYVSSKGHAVCAFLAHEPNFKDAAGFVQRSSIWDANQSVQVTAGAIVSYCPQSQPSGSDQLSPAYQSTLSDLQAIEGKLQGIQGNLQDIQGGLDNLPGHP